MKELECPACGNMIPDDSRYCDMCGVELLECVNCGTLGTDPFCPNCGKPMIARKSGDKTHTAVSQEESRVAAPNDGFTTMGGRGKTTVLKFRKGNITIVPEDNAIIGRGEGPYINQLNNFNLISRRHGKFIKRGRDWYIVDFGSTNGTYVNDTELSPDVPVRFAPGDVVDIGTYLFDVVVE